MNKTFTQDHLILLAYNELPPLDTQLLEEELKHNNQLAEAYKEIKSMLDLLPSERHTPHPTSVKIVLEEASLQSNALEV
jgi:hypothetical protein